MTRPLVIEDDTGALRNEETRQCQSLPGCSDDEDTLILPMPQFHTNATAAPNMANIKLTSQNLCTTCVSLHPESSKW